MKKTEKIYAVVSQNITFDWITFYQWADSVSKKWTGHFLDVRDAIKSVPENIRIIKVQIHDKNGKEINYTINRDEEK